MATSSGMLIEVETQARRERLEPAAPASGRSGAAAGRVLGRMPLSRGDRVRVRSAVEILATLDGAGRLEGLPFMPEMAAFCGHELEVYRRADRTCVEGLGLRAMDRVVLLNEARCDGGAHDGCERACLMFWKEAWLDAEAGAAGPAIDAKAEAEARARLETLPIRDGERYLCQSTALGAATAELSQGHLSYLMGDLRRREISLTRFVEILATKVINKLIARLGLPDLGALRGADGKAVAQLKLRSGEDVRVKPARAIADTLDQRGANRGLRFEPEMTPYAGRISTVSHPVTRMIHEETGRMVQLQSTVALKGLYCEGRCTLNCPRANPLFWREAWLERLGEADPQAAG